MSNIDLVKLAVNDKQVKARADEVTSPTLGEPGKWPDQFAAYCNASPDMGVLGIEG